MKRYRSIRLDSDINENDEIDFGEIDFEEEETAETAPETQEVTQEQTEETSESPAEEPVTE